MVKHIKDDQIQLMISRAEIQSIRIHNGDLVTADVNLMVGDKVLTTVQLSNASYHKNDPNYLYITEDISSIKSKLFKIIKKSAHISLERIQAQLPGEVAEVIDNEVPF